MMSRTVPTGAGWAYEIKHDGFRFICRRDRGRVRLFFESFYGKKKRAGRAAAEPLAAQGRRQVPGVERPKASEFGNRIAGRARSGSRRFLTPPENT